MLRWNLDIYSSSTRSQTGTLSMCTIGSSRCALTSLNRWKRLARSSSWRDSTWSTNRDSSTALISSKNSSKNVQKVSKQQVNNAICPWVTLVITWRDSARSFPALIITTSTECVFHRCYRQVKTRSSQRRQIKPRSMRNLSSHQASWEGRPVITKLLLLLLTIVQDFLMMI